MVIYQKLVLCYNIAELGGIYLSKNGINGRIRYCCSYAVMCTKTLKQVNRGELVYITIAACLQQEQVISN